MSAAEWGVLLGGVIAIAWVNWYFFIGGERKPRGASGAPPSRKD
jgi:hypothetical protein